MLVAEADLEIGMDLDRRGVVWLDAAVVPLRLTGAERAVARLLPGIPALRYVVIHELTHIRHHNHSRAFWSALSEALPDWKRSAHWLRANERRLTAYRPRI